MKRLTSSIKLIIISLIFFQFIFSSCNAQKKDHPRIIVGAEQPDAYVNILKDKKVGLVVNQSSLVDSIHLIDFLVGEGIEINRIFAAEHGIRGKADAGETVNDSKDEKTGIPIVSLYGKNRRPTKEQMKGLDIVVFDMQDVGCRFFTYISTMHYLMDAAAEFNVEVVVLDRPNPNGDYVAGAVLDTTLRSFVGMHPIPIVHGCTVGELAMMINGEGWLPSGKCNLNVIPVKNYSHDIIYQLPVKPSPNLPNYRSIRLYPSLCLFEATNISIGRGTYFPFQVIGYPDSTFGEFSFIPKSIEGMSKYPLHENEVCYGENLQTTDNYNTFTLEPFLAAFHKLNSIEKFWKSRRWIDLLTGDSEFYEKVNNGMSENEILKSWEPKLSEYKKMREKYLLYR